jgi:hypothetical protein
MFILYRKYTRIYYDTASKSHFEDVYVEVASGDFAPPAPPSNLATPLDTERAVFCEFPAQWFGDWHPSPRRQFFFQMSGELEIQLGDGEIRKFSSGSLILLDESSGKGHVISILDNSGVDATFVQLPVITENTA